MQATKPSARLSSGPSSNLDGALTPHEGDRLRSAFILLDAIVARRIADRSAAPWAALTGLRKFVRVIALLDAAFAKTLRVTFSTETAHAVSVHHQALMHPAMTRIVTIAIHDQ